VAEIVVERLQSIQVDEEHGDRPVPTGGETIVEVGQQRAPVAQAGQFIVVGQVSESILGEGAGLHLGEERRDGHDCVQLAAGPLAVVELDEAERPGGQVAG
jgi:hypothetical protein